MSAGGFFSGLISGLNQGITNQRLQNQRDAENEIASEQSILTQLVQHGDDATRGQAIDALLRIHTSGKPTGFLGKLTGKRGENPDIAALISGWHPKGSGPDSPVGVDGPQNIQAPSVQGGGTGVFAPPAESSPLPSSPAGPAALPINTTQSQSQIGYGAGVSGGSGDATAAAAAAPATPPPQAFAPPPAPTSIMSMPPKYGWRSADEEARSHAAASARGVQEGQISAWRAAGVPDEVITERLSGVRSAKEQTQRELLTLTSEAAETPLSPEKQARLDVLRQLTNLDLSPEDKEKLKVAREKMQQTDRLHEENLKARAIAQDKTLQGQLRIAQLRIAAAKEGRDEASARKAVKDVEDLKLKLSKYTQPETQVFDNIQIAKPAIEESLAALEPFKNSNSLSDMAQIRTESYLYKHGLQRDHWSNLLNTIAFLNLPTARQYMQGRPNQLIYEDIKAHLPNTDTDTPKMMYDKLKNIQKFGDQIEQGLTQAIDARVAAGLKRVKGIDQPPSATDVDLAALEASLGLTKKK